MSIKTQRPGYLRIVEQPEGATTQEHVQQALFPMPSRQLLCVVNVPAISGFNLIALLTETTPSHIFDLRVVPRFDLAQFNRRKAFDAFSMRGIQYFDIAALVNKSWSDALLTSGTIAQLLARLIGHDVEKRKIGPVVVFVDNPNDLRVAADVLPRQLPENPLGEWIVTVLPR